MSPGPRVQRTLDHHGISGPCERCLELIEEGWVQVPEYPKDRMVQFRRCGRCKSILELPTTNLKA